MLPELSPSSPSSRVPTSPARTQAGTSRSSTQSSSTINLSQEYNLAFQTNSFDEMWFKIHVIDPNDHHDQEHKKGLEQMIQPSREEVQEALPFSNPVTLTSLMSSYFDYSESAFHLCSRILKSVHSARALYDPLHELLDRLPLDAESLTQEQCSCASDVLHQLDCIENPFQFPDSYNFNELQSCFSQLRQQLDIGLCKSRSRIRLIGCATTGCTICLIGTAVGVAISVVAITTHALVAIVACPFFTQCHSPKFAKKELANEAQLDAAAMGTRVLTYGLDTINCLVAQLHTAVESDKRLIRLGLEMGMDNYFIHEAVKQLHKSRVVFIQHLKNLEIHICRFFANINWARSLLLQKMNSSKL